MDLYEHFSCRVERIEILNMCNSGQYVILSLDDRTTNIYIHPGRNYTCCCNQKLAELLQEGISIRTRSTLSKITKLQSDCERINFFLIEPCNYYGEKTMLKNLVKCGKATVNLNYVHHERMRIFVKRVGEREQRVLFYNYWCSM